MESITIDVLFNIKKNKRNKVIKTLCAQQRQDIYNNIVTMTELYDLDKIESYEERVKIRAKIISENPNKIFWDYGEYIRSNGEYTKTISKISTNGDRVTFDSEQKTFFINLNTDKGKRVYKGVQLNGKVAGTLHRAIVCTFCDIPEHLKHIHIKDLVTNHKNSNTTDNRLVNLEWASKVGNTRHYYGYKNYHNHDHYLVTVDVDNGFKGRQFVINKHDDNLPEKMAAFISKKAGVNKYYYGMLLTPIASCTIEPYERKFPKDILDLFIGHPECFNIRIKPVLGKVLVGKYKGLKFSLMGYNEINKFFNQSHVHLSIRNGTNISQGCYFIAVSIKNAIPYMNIMTYEIRKDIHYHLKSTGV